MDIKNISERIKELSAVIKNTDIEKISHKKNGFKVTVKRIDVEGQDIADAAKRKNTDKKPDKQRKIEEVFSHSVGHFRDFMPPSRKSFVKKSETVKKGQKLGLIESMKIMKEVLSPCNGKIIEKFVKHSDAVEYGQKLFEIEVV